MTSLVINIGNGTSAVIGVTSLKIVETPEEIYGADATWNLTDGCLEWCEENGVPINPDGSASGVETWDYD